MQLKDITPVLNGLAASVFIVDSNRQIVLVNDAGRLLFGGDLVGHDFVEAIRNPKCLHAIAKVLAGRRSSEIVVTLQKPVRTTYRITITRIGDKDGVVDKSDPRAVISLENISHIFEAEQMRSVFVANVSHELRSPLTSLNGFIETLKGAAKEDETARERFLNIMEREARRMNRLVGDLLSLSKVEADAHVRPEERVDLIAILKRVGAVLEPLSSREHVVIAWDIAPDIEAEIWGDSDQLQQVFVNLIENAIKYGGMYKTVTIRVSVEEHVAGIRGPAVQIDVVDNGPGIDSEHLPRLTERFYRVDKGRSREKGGTGLGLAIVKHILARHRGRLQAASEVDKGSTFTVFLPYNL